MILPMLKNWKKKKDVFQILDYKEEKYKMKEFSSNTFSFVLLTTSLDKGVLTFWRNGVCGEYYNFFVLAFDIYYVNQQSKWNYANTGMQKWDKGDIAIWIIEMDIKILHFVSMYLIHLDWQETNYNYNWVKAFS